ncbi:LAMI_0F01882g1_1 [Lachancea mirantina]|uniref:Kinetochore protein SPC25 n=1 Tax=Lachancea mirantina TaxID=1230905 RepID=A0A1G4JWB7_9SACH|nr:LAMI_0F01882g1_1 [Lachancea mirantina]
MPLDEFQELQLSMSSFQAQLHDFLEGKKLTLMQLVDEYKSETESLISRQRELQERTDSLRARQASLEHQIESYQRQEDEALAEIGVCLESKQETEQEIQMITNEIEQMTQLLDAKREEIKQHRMSLSRQVEQNPEEVKIYENLLGMKISAQKQDTLTFVFSRVVATDPERECSVTLDFSAKDYKVTESSPKLSRDACSSLEQNLNRTDNLSQFLKLARSNLVGAVSVTADT